MGAVNYPIYLPNEGRNLVNIHEITFSEDDDNSFLEYSCTCVFYSQDDVRAG